MITTYSLRDAVARAYRRAAGKLRVGESYASPVPSSIDIARELRDLFPDIGQTDVRDLVVTMGFTVADGDPVVRRRSSMPVAHVAGEWL